MHGLGGCVSFACTVGKANITSRHPGQVLYGLAYCLANPWVGLMQYSRGLAYAHTAFDADAGRLPGVHRFRAQGCTAVSG